MIRQSAGIGAAALVLSIVIHFLGIGMTFTLEPRSQGTAQKPEETINLSDSFDDLVEFEAQPVTPETAEPVEPTAPEEETAPETQDPVAPTSEALVASPNPQQTPTPDTGTSPSVEPGISGPVSAEKGSIPEPTITEPSGGTGTDVSDALVTPPIGTDDINSPRLGNSEGTPQQADAEVVEPAEAANISPPATVTPTAPVSASPTPEVNAAVSPEIIPPEPEQSSPPEDTESSDTEDPSLSASLRPRIRPAEIAEQGTVYGISPRDDLRAPAELIESPLTAYARDGTNLFSGRQGGQRSGSQGFGGGRGPGNSDVTNYAGLVLVHLNRIPPVKVAGRGWARVVFRINPDGSLASVDIIDGTSSPEIDRAAKSQIRQGAPFPRPPDGESKLLNFVYSIE